MSQGNFNRGDPQRGRGNRGNTGPGSNRGHDHGNRGQGTNIRSQGPNREEPGYMNQFNHPPPLMSMQCTNRGRSRPPYQDSPYHGPRYDRPHQEPYGGQRGMSGPHYNAGHPEPHHSVDYSNNQSILGQHPNAGPASKENPVIIVVSSDSVFGKNPVYAEQLAREHMRQTQNAYQGQADQYGEQFGGVNQYDNNMRYNIDHGEGRSGRGGWRGDDGPRNYENRENLQRGGMSGRHMEQGGNYRREGFNERSEMPRREMETGYSDKRGPGRGRRPYRGSGPSRGRGGTHTGPRRNNETQHTGGGLKERSMSEVSLCSNSTTGEYDDIAVDPTEHQVPHLRGAGRVFRPRGGRGNRGAGRDSKHSGPQLILGPDGFVTSNTDHLNTDSGSEESVVDSEKDFKRNANKPHKKSRSGHDVELEKQKASDERKTSSHQDQGPVVADLLACLQNLTTGEMTGERTDTEPLYLRQRNASTASENDSSSKRPRKIKDVESSSTDVKGNYNKPNEKDESSEVGGKVKEVFDFLLQNFNGRAKFAQLMKRKNPLPDGVDAVSWFKKHKNKFLLFMDKGEVKFVSVFCMSARLCTRYNRSGCQNEECKYLHICMSYLTGHCTFQNCLSHDFFDERNKDRTLELGFGSYKNNEIAKIVRCSIPELCKEYQNPESKHDEACPLIHVCRKRNCDRQCGLAHNIKGSDHNLWVFDIFRLSTFKNELLNYMLLSRDLNFKQIQQKKRQRELDRPGAHPDGLEQDNKIKSGVKPKRKARKRNKPVQSKESSQFDVERENVGLETAAMTENSSSPTHVEVTGRPVPKPRVRSKPQLAVDMGIKEDKISTLVETSTNPGEIVFKFESDDENEDGNDEVESADDDGDYESESSDVDDEDEVEEAADEAEGAVVMERGYDDDDVCSGKVLCEKHVWSQCSNQIHFHGTSHLPYQWQIRMHDGWIFLEATQNELIEKSYCNLEKRIGGIQIAESLRALINFDSMTAVIYLKQTDGEDTHGEGVDVQRLSTRSYICGKDGNMAELTQWCWYFRDNHSLIPYESGNLQYTLEQKYMNGQVTYFLEREEFQYEIDFSTMKQKNLQTEKQRSVIRRPIFVSYDDVQTHNPVSHPTLLKEQPAHSSLVPENWAPLDCHQMVELVKLELRISAEAERVENLFFATMDRSVFKIKTLFRIQNPSMWEKFCSIKKSMEMALRREGIVGPVNEKQLFHGTIGDVGVIRGICHNNVDFRLCGKNATVYGEGAYFARDAKYSNSYATGTIQYMFVSKVLVGQYIKGDSSYRRPPARVGHTLYDSCVDDTKDPSVFVIFEIAQSYPEFLIEYTRIKSLDDPGFGAYASPPTTQTHGGIYPPPYSSYNLPQYTRMSASQATSLANPVPSMPTSQANPVPSMPTSQANPVPSMPTSLANPVPSMPTPQATSLANPVPSMPTSQTNASTYSAASRPSSTTVPGYPSPLPHYSTNVPRYVSTRASPTAENKQKCLIQ